MLRHLLGNLAEGVLTLHWWEAALTTFQLRPEAVNQLFCDNGLPVRVHRAHVGHVRLALEGGQVSLVVERVFAIVALSDVPPPPSEGDRPVIEASASAEPPSTPSPDHAPQGRLPGLMARGVERLVLAVARRVQLRISAVHVRIDGADGVSASLTLRELTLRDQSSPDVAAAMGLAIALQIIGAAATVTTKAAVPPVSAPATVPASAIASAMNAAPCLVPERRVPLTCDASLLRDAAAWEAAMLDAVGRPLCSDHLLAPLSLRMELGVRLGDVPLEGYWLESTLDLGMGDPLRFRLVEPQVRTQIQHKRLALPPPSPRLTSARWHRIASIDRVHLPTCQLDALGMLLAPLLNALPPAEPPESAISSSPLPPSSVLLAERLSQLRQLAIPDPIAPLTTEDSVEAAQRKYIEKVVERFLPHGPLPKAQRNSLPYSDSFLVSINDALSRADVEYPELVKAIQECLGCLMYATTSTRPDIAYPVHQLCKVMHKPTPPVMNEIDHLVSYLARNADLGLTYSREHTRLAGYADASWETKNSTSGWLVLWQSAALTWGSRKQKSIALSTCEAEIIALSEAAKDVVYLRKLVNGLGSGEPGPTQLSTDSKSARDVSYNPEHHDRMKHVERRHFYVRDMVEKFELEVPYVSTHENPADFLTKPMPNSKRFNELRRIIMNEPCSVA